MLIEAGATDDPMVADAAEWVAAISLPDGGVPTVLPSAAGYPRAPWMEPSEGSGFLTYALAGKLWQAGSGKQWLDAATEWCWTQLEGDEPAGGYTVKFAIDFLDAVPDPPRAAAALERMRPALVRRWSGACCALPAPRASRRPRRCRGTRSCDGCRRRCCSSPRPCRRACRWCWFNED